MKPTLRTLKTCCLTLLLATLLFIIFLPFLCDSYLLPRLLEQLPFSHKEMSLSRISPWKVRGTLFLAQDEIPVASIPRFEVQYSPASLLQGKIDTILLDTPTIHLQNSNGVASDNSQSETAGSIKKQTALFPFELPVSVDNIVIKSAHVLLQTEAGKKIVVVNGHIQLGFGPGEKDKYELSTFTADIATEGDLSLTSFTKGAFSPQGTLLHTEINLPNLMDITNFTPAGQDITVAGSVALQGQVALSPDMQVSHYLVNTDINAFRCSLGQASFSPTAVETPIHLELEGNSRELNYKLSGLTLLEPEQADLEASGEVNVKEKKFTGVATVFSRRLDHPFTVSISGTSPDKDNILADMRLSGDTFFIDKDTSAGPLVLNGKLQLKNKQLSCEIDGKIGAIEAASREITLKDITWDIPLHWPMQELQQQKEAHLNIQTISYKKRDTARVSANLRHMSDGFTYRAELTSKMDIEGQVRCSGSALFNGAATAACTLLETTIDTRQLPHYIEIPEATTFVGSLSADATFEVTEKKQAGQLKLHLSKGTFSSGETTISGIETKISLPKLPTLRSEPGQLATIASIDSGKIHLENGSIFFRIENEKQLFLEKARFNWCGGKIELGSLTLASDTQDIEATLYCDRIGFAELLKQFGIKDTEGQGSLSGRLPIDISNEAIYFDDGFLFSTPGDTGIVHFKNTKQLRQGMGDISQTATLDYSIKALENFAYNWTKLSFNTEGDDLLLALQIDGKPAQPLPFGYKNGQIAATEKGPGLQHPVRLDMNFRLPLQELFNTGKAFNP